MTKDAKGVVAALAVIGGIALTTFVAVAFIRWDFNPAHWSGEARGAVALTALLLGPFLAVPIGLTVAGKW